MINQQDRERPSTSLVASPQDDQEQPLLCLSNIQLLWPNVEAYKYIWEEFGQHVLQIGDTYAKVSARRAIFSEEQAREQYRSACQYHQRTLYCGAAMQLEKAIRSLGYAVQRWGYTAIWLKHLCNAEQTSLSAYDMLYRMLLDAAQQQNRLCTTLNTLQRTYFAYCFSYALLPSLCEEDEEEKHHQ